MQSQHLEHFHFRNILTVYDISYNVGIHLNCLVVTQMFPPVSCNRKSKWGLWAFVSLRVKGLILTHERAKAFKATLKVIQFHAINLSVVMKMCLEKITTKQTWLVRSDL